MRGIKAGKYFGLKILVVFFAVLWYLPADADGNIYYPGNATVDSLSSLLLKKVRDQSLNQSVVQSALIGWQRFADQGVLQNDSLITIIDFDKPSTEERLFIIDVKNLCIIHKSLVAHGKRSGVNFAEKFSNILNSNQSSPGFFITGEQYIGKHGLSMRLDGLEPAINSNARKRNIVIHSADYVSYDFIQKAGRLGRSYGCPALPNKDYMMILKMLEQPSLLFIYTSKGRYLANSPVLNQNQ